LSLLTGLLLAAAGSARAEEGTAPGEAASGEAPKDGAATPPPAAEVAWQSITLDEAIAQAKEQETMVLLDVWAAHCHACGDMDQEIWQAPEGLALAEGLIPIKIDTQSPAGRELMKRLPITGLPAVIFLRGDGTEFDRVEGYTDRNLFLQAARPVRDGTDALLAIEKTLQANPKLLTLQLQALDRYLYRMRYEDADSTYQRILRLDPQNASGSVEQAMRKMARFEENFRQDYAKAAEYNKQMVERFPTSPSVGGAVDGVYKSLLRAGRSREWADWICPVLEKYPQSGHMHRAAAMTALHNGFRSPCFAQAARTASQLKIGTPAFMDSIAVILEGAAPAKP
jgi:tetratricopeptide (TPR) repeat protein